MTDLTHDGITQSVMEWALDYGIPNTVITKRLGHGWTVADAITTPIRTRKNGCLPEAMLRAYEALPRAKQIEFNGERLTWIEWERRTGISRSTLRHRIEKGWTVERTLTTTTPSQRDVQTKTTGGRSRLLNV